MPKLTKPMASQLLEQGYLTQEQYDQMFADGIVSSGTRAGRDKINVPADVKADFFDRVYEAAQTIAEELGFDWRTPTADSGEFTVYLKGAGKPRTESEDSGELA